MRTSSGPPLSWLRRTLSREEIAYLGLVLALIGLVWLGIAVHLAQEYRQDERSARQESTNLARGFAESIVRAFDAIDQTLLFVRAEYTGDPTRFDLSTWARGRSFTSGLTIQISIADAQGIVTMSNLGPSPPASISPTATT